jgi:hypothetical protein
MVHDHRQDREAAQEIDAQIALTGLGISPAFGGS